MTLPVDGAFEEVVLPTYTVLARFREPAVDGASAVRQVVERLTAAQEPFHEVTVQQEDQGERFHLVVVRFVLVSVDPQTAVAGLSETLTAAGLTPDEVWAAEQLS